MASNRTEDYSVEQISMEHDREEQNRTAGTEQNGVAVKRIQYNREAQTSTGLNDE